MTQVGFLVTSLVCSSDVISVFTTELQLSASLLLQCSILSSCGRIIMNPFRDVLESAGAENKELIVTGDFNCDFLVKSCSKETRELKEIFRNFGLTQLIDKATRTAKESSTLLDLFASNSPGNINY